MAWGDFVRNGGTSGTQVSGNQLTLTVPAAGHAAGNIVVVSTNSVDALSSVADSKGNTWAAPIGINNGTSSRCYISWSQLTNALVSGDTITPTFAATNTSRCATSEEYDGQGRTASADKSASTTGASGSISTGTTGTQTGSDDLAVAAFGIDGAATEFSGNPGNSYTTGQSVDIGTNSKAVRSAWKKLSDTSATSSTQSASFTENWAGVVVTIQGTVTQTSPTFPSAPRPRAFQEQGGIYSGETSGFQPLAFQIPDPGRAFQEDGQFGEVKAFQDQAFQQPDPQTSFQPEAFWDETSFQMSVLAFQEPSGFQGDAFQEEYRQVVSGAPATTTITAAGAIPSAEAWGTAHVDFVLKPVGLASANTFGTADVQFVVRNAGAVASAEAFGSADRVVRVLDPVAISSGAAFGTPDAERVLSPVGISSATAFGTTRVVFVLYPLGIASAEAWGRPTETGGTVGNQIQVTGVGAIPSATSFGTTHVDFILAPVAIASVTTFGTIHVERVLGTVGIASSTAFGTIHSDFIVGPVGIASTEAFGRPTETGGIVGNSQTVSGVGAIPSATAFGTTDVVRILGPVGLTSSVAFGTAHVERMLGPVGIASSNTFGTTKATRIVYALGAASANAFGTPTKSPQIIRPSGISTSEAFGTPIYIGPPIFSSVKGSVFATTTTAFALEARSIPAFSTLAEDRAAFAAIADTES